MIVTTTNRTHAPAGTVLRVAGELDTFSSDRLREYLHRVGSRPGGAVVVDLSGVTFMSCTALAVLAEARAQLGPRLILGSRSHVVSRLLQVTHLSSYFAYMPDGPGLAAEDDRGPVPTGPAADGNGPRTPCGVAGERAKGLLMAVHGCGAEEAWLMLTRVADHYGVPVGELVDVLIRSPGSNGRGPSSDAAVATLALLMRPPADDAPAGLVPEDAQEADRDSDRR